MLRWLHRTHLSSDLSIPHSIPHLKVGQGASQGPGQLDNVKRKLRRLGSSVGQLVQRRIHVGCCGREAHGEADGASRQGTDRRMRCWRAVKPGPRQDSVFRRRS